MRIYLKWLLKTSLLCLPLLAVAGCSDHGPINYFSQALFNRNVNPPQLAFSSYTPGNYTSNSSPYPISVNIHNIGGCGTYGLVTVVFSCQDPSVSLQGTSGTAAVAIYGNPNQEISPSTGNWTGQAGYLTSNGTAIIISNSYSFTFTESNPTHQPHLIQMLIRDALNNTWQDQFTVYP